MTTRTTEEFAKYANEVLGEVTWDSEDMHVAWDWLLEERLSELEPELFASMKYPQGYARWSA